MEAVLPGARPLYYVKEPVVRKVSPLTRPALLAQYPILELQYRLHFSEYIETEYLNDTSDTATETGQAVRQLVLLPAMNRFADPLARVQLLSQQLSPGALLCGWVKLPEHTRQYMRRTTPKGLWQLRYVIYFLVHRLFPKLSVSCNGIYQYLFSGTETAITKTELLGMLLSQGFQLKAVREEADGRLAFTAEKKAEANLQLKIKRGPLFRMKRMGKQGKTITVYKLRTMHPYAEYLQQYLRDTEGLEKGGKFKNDFRVARWGKWLRKFWIDEIPMLYNLMKGDLKLVGVRPLSAQYFSMYPKELQDLRIRHKPGLIPPFYADLPATLDEIVASELNYLRSYEKNGWKTDLLYLRRIARNILLRFSFSK